MTGHTLRRISTWAAILSLFAGIACPMLHRGWVVLGTDFPNYYLLAHLRAEGVTVDRAYEWLWLQRQKDHLQLAQPLVGLGQITPISCAVLWPIAKLSALTAKHIWMVANACFLTVVMFLLRRITGVRTHTLLLATVCCVPLWRNFEYGQFYLLLFLLILFVISLERDKETWASGFLIGLAAGLKVFPILLLIVPMAKGRWKAAVGALSGVLMTVGISVTLFGRELSWRYATEVLPRGLRGDVADPYSLGNASPGAALRRLFVFDAGLNPHPLLRAPFVPMIVGTSVCLLLLAMVWYVAASSRESEDDLVWSSALVASLLISSAPASYQFVLLLLPVCALLQQRAGDCRWQSKVVIAYLAAILPWPAAHYPRLAWLLPRWCATLAVFLLLWTELRRRRVPAAWTGMQKINMAGAIACGVCLAFFALKRTAQVPPIKFVGKAGVLYEGYPQWSEGTLHAVRLVSSGYQAGLVAGRIDELSLAASANHRWVEQAGAASILRDNVPEFPEGHELEGESPAVSASGTQLAFLREAAGRGVLFSSLGDGSELRQRTNEGLNVYETSIDDSGEMYLAAMARGTQVPQIYFLGSQERTPRRLISGTSRYPAVSPDGAWLAYSEEVHGSWQLRLMNLRDGSVRHLTDADCNVIEPAWKDRRTLLAASDCGRGLGLTGIFELHLP